MNRTDPARASSDTLHIPYYFRSLDWDGLIAGYPPPPLFSDSHGRFSPDAMRALQEARFLDRVKDAWALPFYRDRWRAAGVEPEDIRTLDDIVKLPVFTSDDLKDAIEAAPPFGSHHPDIASLIGKVPLKVHTSGGTTGFPRPTVFDPIAFEVQSIQAARAMYAQGARPGDVLQITYNLSMANAGWCAFGAAFHWLGCMPLTPGTGTVTPSIRQLEYAQTFGTTGWYARGDYLARLTQVAEDAGMDLHALPTKSLHTFLGPDVDGTRRRLLEEAWGAPVFDNYGSHEVGHIAFECEAGRRHVSDDTVYVELCDVETREPVASGELGDIVVTSLHRSIPPIIRYDMRDLLRAYRAEPCECGLCTTSLSMFLGRSDEMVKVRGTNVYPLACQAVIDKHPGTNGEYLCVVSHHGEGLARREEMTVVVERRSASVDPEAMRIALEEALQAALSVKLPVEVADPGGLEDRTLVAGSGKRRRLLDLRK